MTENKRDWLEPELIVLVRNKPEEAVLTSCKGATSSADPYNSQTLCQGLSNCPTDCMSSFTS